MRILKSNLNIDFIKYKKIATIFSAILLICSITAISLKGLNLGLDFTGGTLVQVGYQNDADLKAIRDTLNKAGYEKAVAQPFGTSKDVMIRLAPVPGKNAVEIGNNVVKWITYLFINSCPSKTVKSPLMLFWKSLKKRWVWQSFHLIRDVYTLISQI